MNRKLLIGLGALAAVVLLAVFVVMPLVMPGDDLDDEQAAAADGEDSGLADDADADADADDDDEGEASDGEADEGEADDESEPDPVDETFEVFTARDPFQQLVSDSGGTATPISDRDSGDDDDGSGSTDDDDDDGDGGGSSGASVDGTVIELIEVYDDPDDGLTVQITVNGTGYEVTEGDDFAQRFRVLDISDSCATLLYGDQRFTLCEGETVRK